MKHLKTYASFLNEADLPFTIEKELRLEGVTFELDSERELSGGYGELADAAVYVGTNRGTGAEWTIVVGSEGSYFYIEIQKNDAVLFSNKYPRSRKQYFDQDCMNSLGFLPEID